MSDNIPQFFASAFYKGIVRIDSPASHVTSVYEEDTRFFAHNKRRKMYIRSIWPDEFGTTFSDSPRPFQIHVLVKQLAIGTHEVTAAYVGRSFWLLATTDLEIIQALIEIDRRRGIESAEWDAFTRAVKEHSKAPQLPPNAEAIQ